jgi:hypothetical protein
MDVFDSVSWSFMDSSLYLPHPEADLLDISEDEAFIAALVSGGDSRLALDPRAGINKYLCPPVPAEDLICASSCTASPIAPRGFQQAAKFYSRVVGVSPRERAGVQEECSRDVAGRLLAYFGVVGRAEVILCPSGTDALQTAAMLVAAEWRGAAMTAILPQASETGTGVPRATTLRQFDGPAPSNASLADCSVSSIEIPLRTEDGLPRSDDAIVGAYAAAAATVRDRPVVYVTYGTKTGLIAPVRPPAGAEVIVDACQARIEPEVVAGYLRDGWPVVVTGSKFFGGPAFSGAVLYPLARLVEKPRRCPGASGNLGMLLRWVAALDAMEGFSSLGTEKLARLRSRAAAIEQGLAGISGVVPVPGLSSIGPKWSDVPTIFSFAVRDPADGRRLLLSDELRPIYTKLARRGVLLGQPVGLGRFGGLRIAVGARDLLPDASADGDLPGLFAALEEIVPS